MKIHSIILLPCSLSLRDNTCFLHDSIGEIWKRCCFVHVMVLIFFAGPKQFALTTHLIRWLSFASKRTKNTHQRDGNFEYKKKTFHRVYFLFFCLHLFLWFEPIVWMLK